MPEGSLNDTAAGVNELALYLREAQHRAELRQTYETRLDFLVRVLLVTADQPWLTKLGCCGFPLEFRNGTCWYWNSTAA